MARQFWWLRRHQSGGGVRGTCRANEVSDHEVVDVGECSDGAVSVDEVLGDPDFASESFGSGVRQCVLDNGWHAVESRLLRVGGGAQRENASAQCDHPAALMPPCGALVGGKPRK